KAGLERPWTGPTLPRRFHNTPEVRRQVAAYNHHVEATAAANPDTRTTTTSPLESLFPIIVWHMPLVELNFLLAFRRFSARRDSVSIMYSDNAQTFRCVSKHLKVLRSDPAIHDLLAMRKTEWIFSASRAPWWTGFWERMVRTMKDLFRRSNGRACLEYDELEVSLIETESLVNARPLTYVMNGSDDPLPITPNQFLNNRRWNCTPPEPAENLMAPNATNLKLLEMDRQRREYVSDICKRFVTDYFLQIDKFHCKGGPGRKIRVEEVVIL
ncbi:Uncharacterized protein APZ42_010202, partial [Daphnia magna]